MQGSRYARTVADLAPDAASHDIICEYIKRINTCVAQRVCKEIAKGLVR